MPPSGAADDKRNGRHETQETGEGRKENCDQTGRCEAQALFRGASLRPLPPGPSKQKDVRYLDIREDEELDERQFAAWVKQASRLPGERM